MVVRLLRHTKPLVDKGICYGQTDLALSDTFNDELASIRKELAEIAFDGVFSSPLKRCMDLAKFLCPENIEILADDRLKEMNFGAWEMMNWQEISEGKEAQEWFVDYVNVKCPDGESFKDLYNRVKDFIDMLKGQNQIMNPLIVTHAGVIRAFYSIVESVSPTDLFDLNIGFGEVKTFQL